MGRGWGGAWHCQGIVGGVVVNLVVGAVKLALGAWEGCEEDGAAVALKR